MIILAVLSENIVQCPKTLFLCLVYIYTFPIASFKFFIQLIDLGSKNPLQWATKATKIFGTKVSGVSLDFNINRWSIHLLECQDLPGYNRVFSGITRNGKGIVS